jgi:hypothetical protein
MSTDPTQPKFVATVFEIAHKGNTLELKGLVSVTGVTKIFLPSGLPSEWKDILGQVVSVRIGNVILKGNFIHQQVEHGVVYEIKFEDIDEPTRRYIEQRMEAEGISPGWKRKYPRIPVKGYDDPELPVPNLCMVRFVGQEIFVNVVNFTLGGIRIETLGDSLQEIRVGSVLHFDLITSSSEIFANLSGEVRNIAVHDRNTPEGRLLTRSFGLSFVDMDPVNEKKYRNLIKTYCEMLKTRLTKKEP